MFDERISPNPQFPGFTAPIFTCGTKREMWDLLGARPVSPEAQASIPACIIAVRKVAAGKGFHIHVIARAGEPC